MIWKTYCIWRQRHEMEATEWLKTSRTVTARTDIEAQSKVSRMYRNAGFSGMSLLVLPIGITPEQFRTTRSASHG